MPKDKVHGSVGEMPRGRSRRGMKAELDHGSVGECPSGSGPYNPMAPANNAGHFEGGKGKKVPVPKEVDHSGYSRGK